MGSRTPLETVRGVLLGSIEARLKSTEESLVAWAREARLEAARGARRAGDPRSLATRGYKIFSQFDEDGIVDEVFQRIGTTNRHFAEIGVGDGRENNTMALLLAGWRGGWLEADPGNCRRIRSDLARPLGSGQLRLEEAFVTAENVEELLASAGTPPEPDLLGIDIDGNDFWVWKAIVAFRPRVVVVEYNASLGRSAAVVMPYDPQARWNQTAAYGASLAALEQLGRAKGYALVGCSPAGVNAFFVREDLAGDRFMAPFTAAVHYEPPRFGRDGGGFGPAWGDFRAPGDSP